MSASVISVRRAIAIGTLIVNGPVFVLLIAPISVFAWLVKHTAVSRDFNWVGVLVFALSFVAAWTWWSLSVPRWRLWACERVTDVSSLKDEAAAVGLTWPDGHLFEKTEFKSTKLRTREAQLELKRSAAGGRGHEPSDGAIDS